MKKILLAVTILLTFASPLTRADDLDSLLVLNRPVPRDIKDLRAIEYVAQKVAAQVMQCTVGVQVGHNIGSGVVISESGYVLTAAHVADRPGRKATIRFADGTTVSGKCLGLHTEADCALIKITDEGSWPFAPVVTLEDWPYPKPGDWCIATGHPGGFDASRTPPIRLGRIIDVNATVIRTDCAINSGDSGGPLFDMQGRVIGIHSRIAEHATINLHGPVLALHDSWQQMKDGEIYPPTPESRFLAKLDIDRDGKITRTELPEGTYQQLYDRLASKFHLEADRSYTIHELKVLMGWRHVPPAFDIPPYDSEDPSEHALAEAQYVRGSKVRAAFDSISADVKKRIVEVRCDDKQVAFGTVVEGRVLTKASQLQGDVTCKTHDGKTLAAHIERVDPIHDLALLTLDEQLDGISLSDAQIALGSWLITPGPDGHVISVGVSSVDSRAIAPVPAVLGVGIYTDETKAKIEKVYPNSGAANAGLRENDVIVKVLSQPVSSLKEVKQLLAKKYAGDVVKITVLRDDETLDFEVRLGLPEEIFFDDDRTGNGGLNGELSFRRHDFPDVIQHDSVVQPQDCGGPLLDLSGNVIGINIARADRVATYALPVRVVREFLKVPVDESAGAGED